jgi:NADPH2:quinone reductase
MTTMQAAVIAEIGTTPTPATRERPRDGGGDGDSVVLDVLAVAFNPVDVAIASGRFYAGHPPLPYVPGIECVGRPVGEQRLVYAQGAGMGISADGFAAEQVVVPSSAAVELPAGSDPAVAVALGTAGVAGWLSVTARGHAGSGDVVVVLGATGSVGRVALQAARASGAERVVAVGRSPERLAELTGLADATVAIEGDDLAGRITAACERPPTLIIDGLWGAPAVASMLAAAPGARLVQLGASAGAEAPVPSAAVRGKQLDVLGYSNFGLPRAAFADGYRELVELANDGRVTMSVERFALADVATAWDATVSGRAKAVVCPQLDRGAADR